ncbi:hypothetical protein C8Q76DRAFT_69519 [Earliella scabrosa]|nr:hypothetical protein C8Q76DRAFT_69519 [Earliella scabrosa]
MLALVLSFEPGDAVREALDDRDRTDLQTAVKQPHARGVCHGDLAPRTVLRMQDGTWTIVDFGRGLITDDDYDQRHDLSA